MSDNKRVVNGPSESWGLKKPDLTQDDPKKGDYVHGKNEFAGRHITAPETATVGQYLRVKAVDENGKPTEWEAVDRLNKLIVNISDDGNGMYADKTFHDIQAAHDAGAEVVCHFDGDLYPLDNLVDEMAVFVRGVSIGEAEVYQKLVVVHNDETVEHHYYGIGPFAGANEDTGCLPGLVQSATPEDRNKFLRGDGNWAEVSTTKKLSEMDNDAGYLRYQIVDEVPAEQEEGVLYIVQID